jgi:hypothetical protein
VAETTEHTVCTSGENNITGCSQQPKYDVINSSLNFISICRDIAGSLHT